MFDRILIPLDGSLPATSALYAGERLADRWDADITILSLMEKSDRKIAVDRTVEAQAKRIQRERDVEIRDVTYSIVDDIADEFDEVSQTLVVMSTWARNRGAAVVSNVAEAVMRHIRQPMLLLGPEDEIADDWPTGPLCVCTDGSAFARSIVPLAEEWAASLNLMPTVLTVIDDRKIPAEVPVGAESNAVARIARNFETTLDTPVSYDTLHGPDPADAIVDYARVVGASMIAMATHGRSGMHRLRYGSVAMKVIRGATCPVLVARPPAELLP